MRTQREGVGVSGEGGGEALFDAEGWKQLHTLGDIFCVSSSNIIFPSCSSDNSGAGAGVTVISLVTRIKGFTTCHMPTTTCTTPLHSQLSEAAFKMLISYASIGDTCFYLNFFDVLKSSLVIL